MAGTRISALLPRGAGFVPGTNPLQLPEYERGGGIDFTNEEAADAAKLNPRERQQPETRADVPPPIMDPRRVAPARRESGQKVSQSVPSPCETELPTGKIIRGVT